MKTYLSILVAVVSGFLASYASLQFLSAPFILILFSWFLVSCFIAICCRNQKIKLTFIYIGAGFFGLGLFEAYLTVTKEEIETSEVIITPGYYRSSDILGYGPNSNIRVNAKKIHGKELVYDVQYTIESNGLRKSPPHVGGDGSPCILFFGGSVTFGEGVNDEETMPFRVGIKTKGHYQIHNFAFHGYGPHQMLSALEHGLVDKKIQCDPKFVFYQAILPHTARSAGLASWDEHGPKYIIGETGEVRFAGNFDDNKIIPANWVNNFKKSLLFLKLFGEQRPIYQADIDIFLGIVKKTRDLLKNKYPNATFHVLYWDSKAWNPRQEEIHGKLIDGFKNHQIPVHLLGSILPKFHENQPMYELGPHDHHPNAQAHDLIAQYLTENVIWKDNSLALK